MARFSAVRWCAYHFFYRDRDLVLVRFVRPVVASLFAERLIDRFFFIRYPQGGPHVRLRFRLGPEPAGVAPLVEKLLEAAAAEFLERWPPEAPPELAVPPWRTRGCEPVETAGVLLPFPFEPETERYGGEDLLPHSLDFFSVSSLRVLEVVVAQEGESGRRRLARAMRLLLQQAVSFAASDEELLSLLSYRLPIAGELESALHKRGDRQFETLRADYLGMIRHEAEATSDADAEAKRLEGPGAFFAEGARRLSRALLGAAPDRRWQIATSQQHMTANRLGLSLYEETYLGRILWCAARETAAADPTTWRSLTAALTSRRDAPFRAGREGLEELLDARLRPLHLAALEGASPSSVSGDRFPDALGGAHASA